MHRQFNARRRPKIECICHRPCAVVLNSLLPPHRPRDDGLSHPADTSRTNLASAWLCFRVAFPNPMSCGSPAPVESSSGVAAPQASRGWARPPCRHFNNQSCVCKLCRRGGKPGGYLRGDRHFKNLSCFCLALLSRCGLSRLGPDRHVQPRAIQTRSRWWRADDWLLTCNAQRSHGDTARHHVQDRGAAGAAHVRRARGGAWPLQAVAAAAAARLFTLAVQHRGERGHGPRVLRGPGGARQGALAAHPGARPNPGV
jgi:hypothetical protein